MATIRAPRLPAQLTPLADPSLTDGTDWEGLDITGEVGGPHEVAFVEMAASRLAHVRLTGRHFDRLRLVDVLIEDCELSAVTLAAAHLTRVEFRRCRLSGLVGSTLEARHVRFTDCKADESTFRMTSWDAAEFRNVDLRNADFHAATFRDVRLLSCDLSGADLSKARMAGTALHGSNVEGIRGADSLRGAVIGSDQVLPLAIPVFAALGIVVDDDHDPDAKP